MAPSVAARTKGPDYLDMAQRYLNSADIIANGEQCFDLESPIATLALTAIELALKAVLLQSYVPKKTIKSYKHDLVELTRSAIENGLSLDLQTVETIIWMDQPYGRSETRYDPELTTVIYPSSVVRDAAKYTVSRSRNLIDKAIAGVASDAFDGAVNLPTFDLTRCRVKSDQRKLIAHFNSKDGIHRKPPVKMPLGSRIFYRPCLAEHS